jgi:hypothetical protein
MIRLGKEHNQLIHKAAIKNTGATSPKPFFMGPTLKTSEWEFVIVEGEIIAKIHLVLTISNNN